MHGIPNESVRVFTEGDIVSARLPVGRLANFDEWKLFSGLRLDCSAALAAKLTHPLTSPHVDGFTNDTVTVTGKRRYRIEFAALKVRKPLIDLVRMRDLTDPYQHCFSRDANGNLTYNCTAELAVGLVFDKANGVLVV